jgi:hypothetical protein
LFGIQAAAVQLQKGIVHLQFFCVVLGDWVSLNQEKVGRGPFLCLVLGVFWDNFIQGMKHWYKHCLVLGTWATSLKIGN